MKHAPPALAHLEGRLRKLEEEGLLRTRPKPFADVGRSFCSNDYLGLAGRSFAGATTGAGASRLIVGERGEHADLESALAEWLGVPATLLFSSGYAANLGLVACLVEPGDLVVSDALNHASMIDGCRLARAHVEVVPHLDHSAVERALRNWSGGHAWVLTESYFSMDADAPDLRELRRITTERAAALVVDEAHALGVFGPRGRGRCAEADVVPDVLVGTLGKAFGGAGAFVAGSRTLVDWLWNRARSFVFSTGMSPILAAAALRVLPEVAAADSERRARLLANAREMRAGLHALGLDVPGEGPILPVILGSAHRALQVADELTRRGLHAHAVRPPTVPAGTARLRLTVTAAHTSEDIRRALSIFQEALSCLGPSS